jgi:hypothetical protein
MMPNSAARITRVIARSDAPTQSRRNKARGFGMDRQQARLGELGSYVPEFACEFGRVPRLVMTVTENAVRSSFRP